MATARERTLIIGSVVVVLAVVLGAPLVLNHLDFFAWDPPRQGTIVAERPSPDGVYTARVTAADSAGHYVFTLRHDGDVVVSREISAPVGYHSQIVRVDWAPDGSRAIATIDHDFGDNNIRVALVRPSPRKRS
jgi:hypothetical protein